jgi:hypothetical protein
VAPRLIATDFFVTFEEFYLQVLWHLTMMAFIASIAIDDGIDCVDCNWQWQWCCCLLLLVTTVPCSDACVMFTARIFNVLITIQTELSFY